MVWANPRDIALIFLSLEAMVMAVIPLALLAGLAYGIYRLRGLVREYLRLAFSYAEMAREWVEEYSRKVAAPFIWFHARVRMIETILRRFTHKRPMGRLRVENSS
ncbi:MAG: hypothetical protein JXB35_04035 [Anaerolineae bacterium]|nr:hypothetical protein [Anaerolineae bacterium]